MTVRSASGSSRSPSAVEPARAQKTMGTTFRTRLGTGRAGPPAPPQARQKRAPSGFSWPQAGQAVMAPSVTLARAATIRLYGSPRAQPASPTREEPLLEEGAASVQ